MLTDYNPALYDGDGNLIVPRHGIRVAMALAFADACAFWLLTYIGDRKWHELNPGSAASSFADPLWIYLLWLALPAVPLLVSELLLSARSEEAIAAGAGVAASLFLNSLIASLAAAVGFFLWAERRLSTWRSQSRSSHLLSAAFGSLFPHFGLGQKRVGACSFWRLLQL